MQAPTSIDSSNKAAIAFGYFKNYNIYIYLKVSNFSS